MTGSPKILAFASSRAAFEITFPVLERLQVRGRVRPHLILRDRLRRQDPRLGHAVEVSGVSASWQSIGRLELLSLVEYWRADAVYSHTDPIAQQKTARLRDRALKASGAQLFYMQHGMIQWGVNRPLHGVLDYYADRLLLWSDPGQHMLEKTMTASAQDRIRYVGFAKPNTLPPLTGEDADRATLASFRKRILICHKFGQELDLFSLDALKDAYAWIGRIAARNRDVLFVLRGHRGRSIPERDALDDQTETEHPNIVISRKSRGLIGSNYMHDIMVECDLVITHPSTVVLDAIYDDIPVAVMNNDDPLLTALPQIKEEGDFQAFIEAPEAAHDAMSALRSEFGEIDDNLDRAASVIEDRMLNGS